MTQLSLAAEHLLEARRTGTLLADLPTGAVPANVETAYAIQDEVVGALGAVGAWKVAPISDTAVPFASPLLASVVVQSGTEFAADKLPGAGIEVEIAVTLNKDLPARDSAYTNAEIADAIGSVHVVLEILSSRFVDRSAVDRLSAIADLQSNGLVVVGPAHDFNSTEFANIAMTLTVDGTELGQSAGASSVENVLASLSWLATHAAGRGKALKAGTVIITGARIGPSSPGQGKHIVGTAAGLGEVMLTLV